MLFCNDLRHQLSKLEKLVIEYMNKHSDEIINDSITDVADKVFVSAATVSRAVRKCGYESFNEARNHLAHQNSDDAARYCINEILSKSYMECIRTIELIHVDDIKQIAQSIRQAKRIVVLARGITRLVAEEFSFQLECQGCNVSTVSDGEIMKKFDLYVREDDLVIILSVQNTTPELAIAARIAKQRKCKIITCCCVEGSELQQISDITVLGYSCYISPNRNLGSTSRIPLMLITRTIVEYMDVAPNAPQ